MSNQNNNFDFEEFAVRSIRYIDSMRSYQKQGSKPTESRINTFYRALGLPSVVPENEQDLQNGRPDPINNGNIHDINFSSYKSIFDERQGLYDKKIENEEIVNFLDSNVQSLKSSISSDPGTRRKRGVLFPMLVDGRIHVFPQSRRIGGAFMTNKQLRHNNTLYKRPLIESILLVKLKGQYVVDGAKQSSTNIAFQTDNLDLLNKNADARLTQTLNTIVYVLESVCGTINKIRKDIGANLIPTVENIAQQNPVVSESDTRIGKLDKMGSQLESQEILQNSVMSLFEFDDIAGSNTRNLRGDGLIELFIEMLVSSSRSKRHTLRMNRRIEKATGDLKSAFRSLDLLLGTFSAISGVDIMVVISALYRLDPEYLVGLLNEESQDRLKAKKGNIPAITDAKGVSEALQKLETEITKIFDELEGHGKVIKHKDKIRNQDSEEETE